MKELDLDDVAATSQKAKAELEELRVELAKVNNEFGSETADWPDAWRRVAAVKQEAGKCFGEIEELRAENERLKEQLKTCDKLRADLADDVTKAVRRAWFLGQEYWRLGDSESYSENRQSDEIGRKFEALMKETRDLVLSGSAAMTTWQMEAVAWLRGKAAEQAQNNDRWPEHAKCYPSWTERVGTAQRLADELEREAEGKST
jgi:chromosome segregation ATPase